MEKNYVAMDIPLFTRILEECREGIESDAQLHFLLDKIIECQLASGRVLTMDDYADIMSYQARYAFVKEQLETKENDND